MPALPKYAGGSLIAAGLATAAAASWYAQLHRQSLPMERMWMPPTAGESWSQADFGYAWSMWAIMMLAMMLPVITPMAVMVARANRSAATKLRIALPPFLAGYLLVWAGCSAAMALLQWRFHELGWLTPMMDSGSSTVAAAILLLGGAYQFTRWKTACLNHCRAPMGFLLSHWRPCWRGSLRLGFYHGGYCLGCCWAEMLVMFAVGLMNLPWMALITLALVAERYLPGGAGHVRRLVGGGLIAWGLALWY